MQRICIFPDSFWRENFRKLSRFFLLQNSRYFARQSFSARCSSSFNNQNGPWAVFFNPSKILSRTFITWSYIHVTWDKCHWTVILRPIRAGFAPLSKRHNAMWIVLSLVTVAFNTSYFPVTIIPPTCWSCGSENQSDRSDLVTWLRWTNQGKGIMVS